MSIKDACRDKLIIVSGRPNKHKELEPRFYLAQSFLSRIDLPQLHFPESLSQVYCF